MNPWRILPGLCSIGRTRFEFSGLCWPRFNTGRGLLKIPAGSFLLPLQDQDQDLAGLCLCCWIAMFHFLFFYCNPTPQDALTVTGSFLRSWQDFWGIFFRRMESSGAKSHWNRIECNQLLLHFDMVRSLLPLRFLLLFLFLFFLFFFLFFFGHSTWFLPKNPEESSSVCGCWGGGGAGSWHGEDPFEVVVCWLSWLAATYTLSHPSIG